MHCIAFNNYFCALEAVPTLTWRSLKCKKPNRLRLGFSMFWLPDLDSNQGPAD